MEQLTIAQAIIEGYTHWGYSNREWQSVNKIEENMFDDIDIHDHDSILLFSKVHGCPSISTKEIAELLSDHIGENDSEECMRDDDRVYQTVLTHDFSEVCESLNKALSVHKYWMITDIKLVKD